MAVAAEAAPAFARAGLLIKTPSKLFQAGLGRVLTGDDALQVTTWKMVCEQGRLLEAVDALDPVVQRGSYVPDSIFYQLLRGCMVRKDLLVGRRLHALSVKSGHGSNTFLANHIIRMYASHGRLQEASDVFAQLAAPDSFMWYSIISAHAEYGKPGEALKLYGAMRRSAVKPNDYIFMAVLKACTAAADVELAKQVHFDVLGSGAQPSVLVGNCLVDLYVKCGRLQDGRGVFDNMSVKNVVSWTAMIGGYAQHGQGQEALTLYSSMVDEGLTEANQVTFVCVLKACASAGALDRGKELETQIQATQLEADIILGNCLVDMYAKCGSLKDARRVFDRLPMRDVVTWNTLIAGYIQDGLGQEALTLYKRMQEEGLPPDIVTFVGLLKACAGVGALHEGKAIHSQIQERGLDSDLIVGSSLVDMYAKCGSLEDARKVFDDLGTKDVVAWTAMITGYVQHGLLQEALAVYRNMQTEGITPANPFTFVCLLKACAINRSLLEGKQLYRQIQEQCLDADVVVGSSLVDMFAKCSSLEEAREVFDKLPNKDVVTWNAMIAGYVQHGLYQEALNLHGSMQQTSNISRNRSMFVCLLRACAALGALQQGKQLHFDIQESGLLADVLVGSSLVDMYAKCGSLEDARTVLDSLPTRNVVAWTALLNGYGQHCDGQTAIQCFQEMEQQGVSPDDAAFTCLLVACSHQGLVDEGQKYFKLMVESHGITPSLCHYNCMVDLLGRAGHLDEAENMLLNMPFESDLVGWTSLLSSCKTHGDVQRGKRCFDRLVQLRPQHSAAYVLLSNIYANAGMWSDVGLVENLRRSVGACKKPATAWIELNSKVHAFCVGEERDDVASKLRSVNIQLEAGSNHETHTELRSELGPDHARHEDALCGHAEKLALAYGLLNTPDGQTLLVTKNLRMCNDCHSGTKIMSRVEKREIIVRDAHRVHHFVDGFCSCGDQH